MHKMHGFETWPLARKQAPAPAGCCLRFSQVLWMIHLGSLRAASSLQSSEVWVKKFISGFPGNLRAKSQGFQAGPGSSNALLSSSRSHQGLVQGRFDEYENKNE